MFNYRKMKELRLELRLSVAEATQRAGWTAARRTYWHRLEKGTKPNPTVQTLCEVSQALDCEPADLIS
jgi:DNA-binding Xre family transcriptional regulator